MKMSQKNPLNDDHLADSLQLDPTKRHDKEGLEEKGAKFLKKVDDIRKQETMTKLQEYEKMTTQVRDQESTIQRQAQEIDLLKAHMQNALKDMSIKDDQLKKLEEKCLRQNEECQKLSKELKAYLDKNEQLKGANMEVRRQLGGLEKQKQGVEKEQGAMLKAQKKFETELTKKDQKISKLTEELEKAKLELKSHKFVKTEEKSDSNKLNERLIQENKKLEKQRNELLNGFRKQLKLIEILKRQKVHLEAAQL